MSQQINTNGAQIKNDILDKFDNEPILLKNLSGKDTTDKIAGIITSVREALNNAKIAAISNGSNAIQRMRSKTVKINLTNANAKPWKPP